MSFKTVSRFPIAFSLFCLVTTHNVCGEESTFVPYGIDWAQSHHSLIDMSGYLDAPAGKHGFIGVRDEHLIFKDGSRFRIWGVNIGARDAFPPKDQAATVADDLARYGINAVRFHNIEGRWSPLFGPSPINTQTLDPESLDRLDFFIAKLAERGIYSNLNLNVSRRWTTGDEVRDADLLGYGKASTYFNPRLIELQKDFARKLLTHRNPYTGNEYRYEPAIVTVELINENSVLEAWVRGRLVGEDVDNPGSWTPIPVSYAQELTDQYNEWLAKNVPARDLASLRADSGGARVQRLAPEQFQSATKLRFHTEARFYVELEQSFFEEMRQLLKVELGVRSLILGTADHSDSYCGYAHVRNNALLDFIDGHGYWEHPSKGLEFRIENTPMVNDPLDSTVVQFARTPMVGKPFTISETNHPYPGEAACEGMPILTAYALFHDWDGIYWFAWGGGRLRDRSQEFSDSFRFSNDPVKMTNVAACAPMWYRRDLKAANQRIVRVYNETQMIEGLRLPRSERPFFDAAFPRSTPLVHATRWSTEGNATTYPHAASLGQIEADTGQLGWYNADQAQGQVVIDAPATQALIGHFAADTRSTANMVANLQTPFASVVLTSLDDQPIAASQRLLVAATAKTTHTGFEWYEDRKRVKKWGTFPSLIQPVTGRLTLRGLGDIVSVEVQPLTAEGRPLGSPTLAAITQNAASLILEDQPTTWYEIRVERKP